MTTEGKIIWEQEEEQKMEKRARMEFDRLSNLPEPLQLHILSFLDTKQVVQTSVLSTSWHSLWKLMPVLHLDRSAFREQSTFDMFVNMVLRYHDQSAKLSRLTFYHRVRGHCTKMLNKVVDYAFSCGVKQLEVINNARENVAWWWPIGSSDSLTSLKLESEYYVSFPYPSFKNLTVLHLTRAIIRTPEPFSRFPMLEKLTLHDCCDIGCQSLCVHAPKLSDLTISGLSFDSYELTTPNLRFFEYQQVYDFPLFRTHDGFPVLDTVLIDFSACCFRGHDKERVFDRLISLFRDFHNAKSLALSMHIVDGLSLFPEKLMNLDSPFCNLKCLNILHLRCNCNNQIPSNVRAYLLHNSPEAKFNVIYDQMQKV